MLPPSACELYLFIKFFQQNGEAGGKIYDLIIVASPTNYLP